MTKSIALFALLLIASVPTRSQIVESPISLKLGVGGGVSLPTGSLGDAYNTGWNAGAKVRLGGWIPVNLVAVVMHNSLPLKGADNSDDQLIVGGGIEYAITSVVVHPYFGADYYYVNFDNQASGTPAFNRGGLGVGAGVEFAIPGFGSFDTGVKYQYLNVTGKEEGENDISQIAATVTLMLGLL
jgi:hypothetical protein